MLRRLFALTLLAAAVTSSGEEWTFKHRLELRANVRRSDDEKFPLRFPFPPEFVPAGQPQVFEQTVDPGTHAEVSVVQLQLEAKYGNLFFARAQIHGQDLYRRNPTSSDKQFDADEFFVRFGPKPEFLDRPERTSFFLQIGKAPKMERQPVRLLESYGLAATAFNRFEDIQALGGGTVGRNLYWRLQVANGNPLFFRDPNALAGDNGTPELRQPQHPHPSPKLGSGFPILYNAEVEGYGFESSHLQLGEGVGYRWQNESQTAGYDVILFHYRRSLAKEKNLTGTFYGGDLDLLDGTGGISLPVHGRTKEEYGGRLYGEWHDATVIVQFTRQELAGLGRQGAEVEAGYRFNRQIGWVQWIQPALRWSALQNDFRAASPKNFVAPSVWWPWTKIDAGVRVGLPHNADITVEHARHNIGAPRKLKEEETLVTLRVRL